MKARSTLHFVLINSVEIEPSVAVEASVRPPQVSNGDVSIVQLGVLSSKSVDLLNQPQYIPHMTAA